MAFAWWVDMAQCVGGVKSSPYDHSVAKARIVPLPVQYRLGHDQKVARHRFLAHMDIQPIRKRRRLLIVVRHDQEVEVASLLHFPFRGGSEQKDSPRVSQGDHLVNDLLNILSQASLHHARNVDPYIRENKSEHQTV